MIVGGDGVGLIPCDLGCINGVDLSLHFFCLFFFFLSFFFFFFLEFCVDFVDFFLK